MTQINLGNALGILGASESGTARLDDAVRDKAIGVLGARAIGRSEGATTTLARP